MKTLSGTLAIAAVISLSPLAEATPQDEAAIQTIVESVATFADRGEFDALERLYAETVEVDYSSLNGLPSEMKAARTLMTEWASVLPGFERTRHDLSDIAVSIDENTATASANVVAGHWIDSAYWEVTGRYDYALETNQDEWKITSMTFTLESESGSRDVFGPAMEAAAANPVTYLTGDDG